MSTEAKNHPFGQTKGESLQIYSIAFQEAVKNWTPRFAPNKTRTVLLASALGAGGAVAGFTVEEALAETANCQAQIEFVTTAESLSRGIKQLELTTPEGKKINVLLSQRIGEVTKPTDISGRSNTLAQRGGAKVDARSAQIKAEDEKGQQLVGTKTKTKEVPCGKKDQFKADIVMADTDEDKKVGAKAVTTSNSAKAEASASNTNNITVTVPGSIVVPGEVITYTKVITVPGGDRVVVERDPDWWLWVLSSGLAGLLLGGAASGYGVNRHVGAERDQARTDLAARTQERDTARQERDARTQERDQSIQERDQARANLATRTQERDQAQAQLQPLQQQLQQETQSRAQADQARQQAQAQLQPLQNQLNAETTLRQVLERQVTNLQNQMQQQQAQFAQETQARQQADAQVNRIRADVRALAGLRRQVATLRGLLAGNPTVNEIRTFVQTHF